LHSLDYSENTSPLDHVARWLVNAHATSSLASLDLAFYGNGSELVDLEGCLLRMITSAGTSLKRLRLNHHNRMGLSSNLNANTSLQEIILLHFIPVHAVSMLSTVSSLDISTLRLQQITLNGLYDLDALNILFDILVSPRFSSLKHLREITLQIERMSDFLWPDKREEYLQAVEGAEKQIARLRSVYGDRFYDSTDWSVLYRYMWDNYHVAG